MLLKGRGMTEETTNDPVADSRRQWIAHGWSDAAEGMSGVTSVIRVHRALLARIDDQLRDLDLSFAKYELLILLFFSRHGALPSSMIGIQLEVHQTTVSIIVSRLEAQGLVRREPHPTDRRSKLIVLTSEGRALVLEATDRLNASLFTERLFTKAQIRELSAMRRHLLKLNCKI